MSDTATPQGARAHARAMAGTTVEAMPVLPPPDGLRWDEVVAGGSYTSVIGRPGTRVRLTDLRGDACAGVLVHRLPQSAERLNVADTVKVQWQAYLTTGHVLLSDMGRVLAAIVEDTSGRHDAMCGTTNATANANRYGDGAIDGPHPSGRDLFALALAKHGLARRDVAPNVNLFKGVRIAEDGSLEWAGGPAEPSHVELRCELDVLVTVVNVPHPLDPRGAYTVMPLRVEVWDGPVTPLDDPVRVGSPEVTRAYLNTEVVR